MTPLVVLVEVLVEVLEEGLVRERKEGGCGCKA
jgi:hypothetical protein